MFFWSGAIWECIWGLFWTFYRSGNRCGQKLFFSHGVRFFSGKLEKMKKENLEKAVADVKAKILTIREASAKHRVPKSTIYRHCNDNTKPTQKQPGYPTLFREEEESVFINYCLMMSDRVFLWTSLI